ncbi:hypothetical protein [Thiolapillus sp.]
MNIQELFTSKTQSKLPTEETIWQSNESMRQWLKGAFDAILKTPVREGTVVCMPPCLFRYATEDLYSLGLLALFDVRPETAGFTMQDFEYLFCDTFVDYFDFPDNEADKFVAWVARTLYRIAEEDEFLNTTPARFLCGDLMKQARGQLFTQLQLTELASFIPLFISVLFAIHLRGLWPHLYERLIARENGGLVPKFKLLELFLNTWAEEDLRFRTVTPEWAKEVLQSEEECGATHPMLKLDESSAFYALRLGSKPSKRQQVKGSTNPKRSFHHRASYGKLPSLRKRRHYAKGIERLDVV